MKKMISVMLAMVMLMSLLVLPASAASMKKGASGTQVRYLQMQLNFLNFSAGRADGQFDSQVRRAVIAFQKSRGLAVDGIAGNSTNSLLKSEVKAVQQQLTRLGYNPGTADGIPGTKTVAALKKFERKAGLRADGVADARTLQKLSSAERKAGKATATGNTLAAFQSRALENWTLPLKASFKSVTGSRTFGSSRSNGSRAHAGIDFVAAAA